MIDVEVLNRGKGVQGGVTDLLDGRKLPIWFLAQDNYHKIVGIKLSCPGSKCEFGDAIAELHMCFIEFPEFWCTINELSESFAVKVYLIEESYKHVVELRGVKVGNEFL